MAEKLRHYGMGLLLDTVPNHMAASYENPWWTDVLENGQSSAFAGYFDIDWHPPHHQSGLSAGQPGAAADAGRSLWQRLWPTGNSR